MNVIVSYNVYKTTLAKAGSKSYPGQQFAIFAEEGRENISPRWNHVHDLKKVVEELQSAGELIKLGDNLN